MEDGGDRNKDASYPAPPPSPPSPEALSRQNEEMIATLRRMVEDKRAGRGQGRGRG